MRTMFASAFMSRSERRVIISWNATTIDSFRKGQSMANAFLHRIENARQDGLRAGLEIGFQMAADFIALSANDPDCVGKNNTLGEERLLKILAGAKKYEMQFSEAFCTAEESDYQRDLLDRRLKQIFKKSFRGFEERYPRVKEIRYKK